MDRGFKYFLGLVVCTLVVIGAVLQVSGGWWTTALPIMVVREWKPTPTPNPLQITAKSGSNMDPAWSPDNWHLAYSSNRFGNWSIWTMCEDGTKKTQLTANNTICRYPAWSPNGSRIAYLAYTKGQWDLWVMYKDGTDKTKLANGPVEEAPPQWSPDGRLILFTKRNPHPNIWVTCEDSVYQAQLTSEGDNLYPSWSSDGKKIIFSSNRSGNWNVWIMNLDGTNQTQLTKASWDNIKPRLSPDGKQIIWLSDRLGSWHIWSINVDGNIPHLLIRRTVIGHDVVSGGVATDADLSWSPDGKSIVFNTRWINEQGTLMFKEKEYAQAIFKISPTGTDLSAISSNLPSAGAKMGMSNDMQASWSPDAGKIAFVSDRSGNLDIWILNFKGFTAPTGTY